MSFLKKRWVRVILGTIVVVLAIVGFASFLMYPAVKTPSPPRFAKPASQAEANKQDLAYAKNALHEMDRSFSAQEWAAFDRQIDELASHAEDLDAAVLEMGIAKAVAAAGNGHTNLLGALRGLTLNSIPLRFYWFADGLRVVKADPAYAELLGAKVLEIAGRKPEELVQTLSAYVGGPMSVARELAIYPMESPQALHAIELSDSSDAVHVMLQTADGQLVERTIGAVPIPASGPAPEKTPQFLMFDPRELHWPRRELSPVPLPTRAEYPQPTGDGRAWAHVLDQRSVPLTLQNPNRFYWSAYLDGTAILFLQINTIMDQAGQEPLSAFLQKTFADAGAKKPQFAIVDLRWNPGGSYQHVTDFTRRLPQLIPANGKVFILTSGNTFSAGIVTTARLKYFSGQRGEIVGERIGDDPQFWAEAATRIVLPNSGLRIGYATGYHDWQNGCSLSQILICYLPNYWLGVPAGDLAPTVPLSWSFDDYLAGRDTAIERIRQLIGTSAAASDETGALTQ
jgi:hypothetical protein